MTERKGLVEVKRRRWFRKSTVHSLVSEKLGNAGTGAKLRVTIDGKAVRAFRDHCEDAIVVWFHDEPKPVVFHGITKEKVYNLAGLWTFGQAHKYLCRELYG